MAATLLLIVEDIKSFWEHYWATILHILSIVIVSIVILYGVFILKKNFTKVSAIRFCIFIVILLLFMRYFWYSPIFNWVILLSYKDFLEGIYIFIEFQDPFINEYFFDTNTP